MGKKKDDEKPDEIEEVSSGDADEQPDDTEEQPETFDKAYVQELRDENARYRTRANDYARRLHTELVTSTGRLAAADDLEFAEEHLENPEKLTAAIDSLLESKPHLKSRRVTGDVNQGNRSESESPTDFLGIMRNQL